MAKKKSSKKKYLSYLAIAVGIVFIVLVVWAVRVRNTNTAVNESLSDIGSTSAITTPKPAVADPDETNEHASSSIAITKKGTFKSFPGESASGTASLVQQDSKFYVRLEDDFHTDNGPDLYVGFGNNDRADETTLFAKLKANNGGQNYEVPSSIDTSKYSQVFIYCKRFSTPFGAATLQ